MRRIANAILTNATAGAAIFGLMHALVDLSCLAVLYWHVQRQSLSGDGLLTMVILYNCIAFGLQGPLGWATDALGAYRAAAAVGLVLTACGASAADWPWRRDWVTRYSTWAPAGAFCGAVRGGLH